MSINFDELNTNENTGKSFTNKTDLYLQFPNQKIRVISLKKINTKFGDTYIVELDTENKDVITLPSFMVDKLDKLMTETAFTDLLTGGKLAVLTVNKKDSKGKPYCTVEIKEM